MASSDIAAEELGLRERKKQRTRAEIVDAAWALFEEQGFAKTTIPQIAEAADVSPRTVSHYFPVKEELAFPEKDELIGALRDGLADREEGETAIDALGRWLDGFIERGEKDADRARRERLLIDSDAGLRVYERGLLAEAELVIASAVASDLALPPDHHMPRMVGAATLAALDSLGREGHEQRSPDLSRKLVADVMRFIGGGVRELSGPKS